MRELDIFETTALKMTGDLANYIVTELPPVHQDDNKDVYYHIRAIQNIIHARPSVEQHLKCMSYGFAESKAVEQPKDNQ